MRAFIRIYLIVFQLVLIIAMMIFADIQEVRSEPEIPQMGDMGAFVIYHDQQSYSAMLCSSNEEMPPQDVVDAENTAWISPKTQGYTIIADHASQGMDILYDVTIGDTMRIFTNDEVKYYAVVGKCRGKNLGRLTVEKNDPDAVNALSSGASHITYTCADADGENIWIVFWKEVKEETT